MFSSPSLGAKPKVSHLINQWEQPKSKRTPLKKLPKVKSFITKPTKQPLCAQMTSQQPTDRPKVAGKCGHPIGQPENVGEQLPKKDKH
jgi:hypothetical protein